MKCDECGQDYEELLELQLDPPIRIGDRDYPISFQVCGSCGREVYEDEKEDPSGCGIIIEGVEVLSYEKK